jgi:hypothetical protein
MALENQAWHTHIMALDKQIKAITPNHAAR